MTSHASHDQAINRTRRVSIKALGPVV